MAIKKKTLVLIRGLPGSGKSTLARALVYFYRRGMFSLEQFTTAHHEADFFFYDKNGVFNYDVAKLDKAHSACVMAAVLDMQRGVNLIVVSNPFIRLWELEPYINAARSCDYVVQEIILSASFPNIHNVPPEAIARMRRHFQYRPTTYTLGNPADNLPEVSEPNKPIDAIL